MSFSINNTTIENYNSVQSLVFSSIFQPNSALSLNAENADLDINITNLITAQNIFINNVSGFTVTFPSDISLLQLFQNPVQGSVLKWIFTFPTGSSVIFDSENSTTGVITADLLEIFLEVSSMYPFVMTLHSGGGGGSGTESTEPTEYTGATGSTGYTGATGASYHADPITTNFSGSIFLSIGNNEILTLIYTFPTTNPTDNYYAVFSWNAISTTFIHGNSTITGFVSIDDSGIPSWATSTWVTGIDAITNGGSSYGLSTTTYPSGSVVGFVFFVNSSDGGQLLNSATFTIWNIPA